MFKHWDRAVWLNHPHVNGQGTHPPTPGASRAVQTTPAALRFMWRNVPRRVAIPFGRAWDRSGRKNRSEASEQRWPSWVDRLPHGVSQSCPDLVTRMLGRDK